MSSSSKAFEASRKHPHPSRVTAYYNQAHSQLRWLSVEFPTGHTTVGRFSHPRSHNLKNTSKRTQTTTKHRQPPLHERTNERPSERKMILIHSSPHFSPLDTCSYYLFSTEKQGNNQDDHSNAVKRTPVHYIRNVQVSEVDDSIALMMDLPGVKEQDIVISENNYSLTIEATRKGGDKEVCKYHRTFSLDKKSVNPAGIEGTLVDGVLTVTIPKSPAPEPLDVVPKALDPPEVKADEDAFQFQLELPGVKHNDLKVTLTGDEVTISAERKTGKSSSSIKRFFAVDEEKVDTARLEAYLLDGILTITAPMMKAVDKTVTVRSFAVNKEK